MLVVFFFKQKTAYEMRISDWSSDVCSSDLESTQLAVGLGCDLQYASKIAYSDGLNLADPYVTPIGPACSICPRVRCPQRAAAPAGRKLAVSEMQKTISPYPFLGG